MGKLVRPKVYLIGESTFLEEGLAEYLADSGNQDFVQSIHAARKSGLSDGEIMCSLFAKLCYKSLTLGKNDNVSRIRDVPDNVKSCFNAGHGSVFEHCQFNFVVANCSRVYTHELVRHRVGTAFSQTSGRYVRGDSLDLVIDPILAPVMADVLEIQSYLETKYNAMADKLGLNAEHAKDFDRKKKLTSALRRILPNGQANEIGFSVNLRALRHMVQVRTSRHAEWEIRDVFTQIYLSIKERHPLVFFGAKEENVEGALEITGMKLQPWETTNA